MSSDHSHASLRRPNAIPTNMISYKGKQMPARIDPEARVAKVIEVMTTTFGASEHHITLCLRDEADRLVTQGNLATKVADHAALKLVPSPMTEALTVVNSLRLSAENMGPDGADASSPEKNNIPLKLALFNLSKYVREEEFSVEFMIRGGVKLLVQLLEQKDGGLTGNSLAYASQGVRGILEFESGWEDLTDEFINRVLHLLISGTQPNILRPTTAIVRKLIISSPQVDIARQRAHLRARSKGKGKEKETPEPPTSPLIQYGFDKVFLRMEGVESTDGAMGVFRVVVKRLEGTGDLELVAQSLGLVNVSLRSAQQDNSPNYPGLVDILEVLNVRKHVSRLMPSCANNIVEPQILNFQARYAGILQFRRHTPVRPAQSATQERMLNEIWTTGQLGQGSGNDAVTVSEAASQNRNWAGWKRIGLWVDEESGLGEESDPLLEVELFRDVGDLGLECLHFYVTHEDNFRNIVIEQEVREEARRCPIGRASAECVKILCEHYKISQAGHHPPHSFQLFLLHFPRLHFLVLRFFLRMWSESESRLPDFGRLSLLVRSHVYLSLADEVAKTWLNLEQDFLETEYRSIRDRQMELLEKEDGMLTRPTVRALREKVGRAAYDVLADQRVSCMLQGNWFNSSAVIEPSVTPVVKAKPALPLRFVRLSPNKRSLGWGEYAHREPVNPPFESLKERIDIANVTDVRMQTGCAVGSRSPNIISKLSFSLMSGPEYSLLDLDAIHAAQLAEWTDGLRVLRGESGMASRETSEYVHVLGELALKIHLLDITGDGIELPEKVSSSLAPQSIDFWFAK
ncbi:hypothetical protein BD324DRAFT_618673 [Kockovaella imperatae]|uniref:ELMO domain-containing protein n=1 Tax=Kockovaella imperatae TaxID=4999 RepID=A0A1Y1UPT7_9TREE|nr:hypothetical protein BD324DRAFT_618673 [Kockovaella imperatae]ORX39155.1 hypothetical protein BD324DRAFT_618673 [Kockovaella imperatae]